MAASVAAELSKENDVDQDLARAAVAVPVPAGDLVDLLGALDVVHLGQGQVRDVGPLLRPTQRALVQQVVELAHAVSAVGDPQKDGGGGGEETGDFAERDLEGLKAAAKLAQQAAGVLLAALQPARGQDAEVRAQVGVFGMDLAAEVLDKAAQVIAHIGHDGVLQGHTEAHYSRASGGAQVTAVTGEGTGVTAGSGLQLSRVGA